MSRIGAALVAAIVAQIAPADAQGVNAPPKCAIMGMAEVIVPDIVANNPAAQKLGIEAVDVRLMGVLPVRESDTCLVKITTNRGYSLLYKFRLDANGVATLDMVPH